MTTPDSTPLPASAPPVRRTGIPGHYVVLGMIGVGLLSTLVIFMYWELHTRPFRPLTEAIGREWRYSLPKVEGGRHKGGPLSLRIAMRVPFPPAADDPDSQLVVNRATELAREHADLKSFERLQVHLLQLAPERLAEQYTFEFDVAELGEALPFPDVKASELREPTPTLP